MISVYFMREAGRFGIESRRKRIAMSTTRMEAPHGAPGSKPTRRDFLRTSGLGGAFDLAISGSPVRPTARDRMGAVILLMMVGGLLSLETFDPKPERRPGRGPRSIPAIETAIPGVRVVEHLPSIARRMGRLTRSAHHHDAAPIHETGLQLLGTGHPCRVGSDHPHFGSVVTETWGAPGRAVCHRSWSSSNDRRDRREHPQRPMVRPARQVVRAIRAG